MRVLTPEIVDQVVGRGWRVSESCASGIAFDQSINLDYDYCTPEAIQKILDWQQPFKFFTAEFKGIDSAVAEKLASVSCDFMYLKRLEALGVVEARLIASNKSLAELHLGVKTEPAPETMKVLVGPAGRYEISLCLKSLSIESALILANNPADFNLELPARAFAHEIAMVLLGHVGKRFNLTYYIEEDSDGLRTDQIQSFLSGSNRKQIDLFQNDAFYSFKVADKCLSSTEEAIEKLSNEQNSNFNDAEMRVLTPEIVDQVVGRGWRVSESCASGITFEQSINLDYDYCTPEAIQKILDWQQRFFFFSAEFKGVDDAVAEKLASVSCDFMFLDKLNLIDIERVDRVSDFWLSVYREDPTPEEMAEYLNSFRPDIDRDYINLKLGSLSEENARILSSNSNDIYLDLPFKSITPTVMEILSGHVGYRLHLWLNDFNETQEYVNSLLNIISAHKCKRVELEYLNDSDVYLRMEGVAGLNGSVSCME